jgi:uncharacterized protein YerC
MPRVSKIKLDKHLEEEIFKQFWYSLAEINSSIKSSDFFSDLLSETEKIMIAKRFATAILITRNKAASDIHKSIHISFTTISSVSAWVKNAKPETSKLLSKISKEKGWEVVADKIEELLDKISPRRGTDWKQKYKEKRERLNSRLIRNDLR